jgi:hypothetical protein
VVTRGRYFPNRKRAGRKENEPTSSLVWSPGTDHGCRWCKRILEAELQNRLRREIISGACERRQWAKICRIAWLGEGLDVDTLVDGHKGDERNSIDSICCTCFLGYEAEFRQFSYIS